MNTTLLFKTPAVLVLCTALSACLGGSGSSTSSTSGGGASSAGSSGGSSKGSSGGSTKGGSLSDYQSRFDAANGQVPTQTAITGKASYSGEVSVRTGANASDDQEAVIGDLAMNIDFDSNVARPIEATVSNLSGEVNGVQTDIGGELSTNNAPSGVNAISTTNVTIMGEQNTFTGMSTELRGKLTDPNGALSGDAIMTMQGDFKGNDGASVSGATAVSIKPETGSDILTGGTFYADKD